MTWLRPRVLLHGEVTCSCMVQTSQLHCLYEMPCGMSFSNWQTVERQKAGRASRTHHVLIAESFSAIAVQQASAVLWDAGRAVAQLRSGAAGPLRDAAGGYAGGPSVHTGDPQDLGRVRSPCPSADCCRHCRCHGAASVSTLSRLLSMSRSARGWCSQLLRGPLHDCTTYSAQYIQHRKIYDGVWMRIHTTS